MRRTAWAAAALLLLAGACAPAKRAPEELVFRAFAPPATLAPVLARFEAENPGWRVRVEPLPRAGAADSIAAALAAGTPPDLCELDGGDMPRFLASGALVDWSAGVADQRDSLRGWELCRVGDALYGLPWRLSARLLCWNRALFAAAGLDGERAPANWEQLAGAAARVQRLGRGVRGYGLVLADSAASFPEYMSYAWGGGGDVLSAALDSSRFDSPANVAALELLVRLRRTALAADADSLEREFAAGRLGMFVASGRRVAALAAAHPALRFGVAAVPAPAARADSAASYGEGEVLVSFVRSRHKEQALRLARFLARPANALELASGEQDGVPANAGADTLGWFRGRPREAVLAREVARARFAPAHPAWSDMQRAIERELGAALLGGKTAAQAVADAGVRLTELAGRRAPSEPAHTTKTGEAR